MFGKRGAVSKEEKAAAREAEKAAKLEKKAAKKAEKAAKKNVKKSENAEKPDFVNKRKNKGLFGVTKEKKAPEPQYFKSAINTPVVNYRVYYLSRKEKILYFILAFVVGAFVGYTFYGGIGRNEFGEPTVITYILDVVISVGVGFSAGKLFLPVRQDQILKKRQTDLSHQFRDMLECFSTSLGAGRNVTDSFKAAYQDLNNQYEEGAFILNELKVINVGIANGVNAEDLLRDFGRRSGIPDIEDFANVFEISYRRGGSIKDVIRNTYEILSDKMQISEEIETMITGSKSELNLMLVLPLAMILLIKSSSPEFSANFVTPAGLASTTIALVFTVAAYMVGRKILDFGA